MSRPRQPPSPEKSQGAAHCTYVQRAQGLNSIGSETSCDSCRHFRDSCSDFPVVAFISQ